MKTNKIHVWIKQRMEEIYVCSAIIGCLVIFSRPVLGAMLLAGAFLAELRTEEWKFD